MKKIYILLFATILTQQVHATFNTNKGCPIPNGDQNQQKSEKPDRELADSAAATMATSLDPNELLGPAGYDTLRWVSINDVLNYTIFFENDDE